MANNIIETFDLTKVYKLKSQKKDLVALNNINLTIKEGEIFGLLGPNGAGKTTLVSIFTTLKTPTSGYATIDGYNIIKNPKQAKNRVALMLGSDMLYYRITGFDNLKFFAKIYKVPNYKTKISNLIKEFGLEKWLNQYVENYSSGMKMKLALCRTLLLERKVLFLDEPTLGLDVKSISFIINRLKNTDFTIFLTSHDMNVVEKLCSRIAFINKGNILKIGTQQDVKDLIRKEIKIEISLKKDIVKLRDELSQQNFVKEIESTQIGLIISILSRRYIKDLLKILSNYDILKINEKEIDLEETFLQIIS